MHHQLTWMRTFTTTLFALSLGLLITLDAAAAEEEAPGFAEGRILVMPAAGLSNDKFEKVLRKANRAARQLRKLRRSRVHVINVPPRLEKRIARFLARHPNIAFAELDELVTPDAIINDPSYSKQWHLPVMGAPNAWQFNDGRGVTVAVLDTGVNANHPDLTGQVLPGWNTVSENTDTTDIHNHGTWVAGVIAAKVNNAVGGASVAPGAKILPIRITNRNDGYAYFSDMAEGIMWAADNGARVANLSYGGAAGSASIANAASYMMSKGGVVMVSAGNDNRDYGYMNHPSLFVAGATTSSDKRASYSSFGNFVDVTAPGSGIYTTARNGGYSTVNGTSFASPNTAAVAALVMAANPSLLPTDVMAVISNTAVDLGDAGWDAQYGYGRVDALAAVQLAAGVETSDTSPPAASITSPSGDEPLSETVTVLVESTDDFGVVRVEFLVNGQVIAEEMQTVGGNEYRFAWDSTTMDDGHYRLQARSYDAAGNIGASDELLVEVVNLVADEIAPEITILSPTPGSTASGSVALMAVATDNEEVTQVSIFAGGKLRCAGTNSASCTWNLEGVAAGSHPITAKAMDAAGNTGTATVSFSVEVPEPEPAPEPEPVPQPEPQPEPAPEPEPEEPVQPPVPDDPIDEQIKDDGVKDYRASKVMERLWKERKNRPAPIPQPTPQPEPRPEIPDEPIDEQIKDDGVKHYRASKVMERFRKERNSSHEAVRPKYTKAEKRTEFERPTTTYNMERLDRLGRWSR